MKGKKTNISRGKVKDKDRGTTKGRKRKKLPRQKDSETGRKVIME